MNKLKKVGNWKGAFKATSSIKMLMQSSAKEFLKKAGIYSVERLKFHIENNDLPWRPLSDAYLEQKRDEGYSSNIYQRTKDFYDSIEYKVESLGVFAGIPKGIQTESGDQMTDIAKIHEFGALSVGIFERPLFRPTMQEVIDWTKKNDPAEIVVKKLKRKI